MQCSKYTRESEFKKYGETRAKPMGSLLIQSHAALEPHFKTQHCRARTAASFFSSPDFYSEWLIHSFLAAAKSHSSANSNSQGYSKYTFNRLLHGTPHLFRQPSPTLRFTIPGKLISTQTLQALRRSYPSNPIRIFHEELITFWRKG